MLIFWWILTVLTAGYTLPAAIAKTRRAEHSGTITLLNILGGWTGIGFLAALIWAILDQPE